jgi:hypothetical protein
MRTRARPQLPAAARTGVDLAPESTVRSDDDAQIPRDLVERLSDLLAAAIVADIRRFPNGPPPGSEADTSQASRPRDIMLACSDLDHPVAGT